MVFCLVARWTMTGSTPKSATTGSGSSCFWQISGNIWKTLVQYTEIFGQLQKVWAREAGPWPHRSQEGSTTAGHILEHLSLEKCSLCNTFNCRTVSSADRRGVDIILGFCISISCISNVHAEVFLPGFLVGTYSNSHTGSHCKFVILSLSLMGLLKVVHSQGAGKGRMETSF